jgi:aspartyl-tRNA(Asn)/glutamyl-tRNA(Gln) amidotransferase subunit C
MLGENVSPGKRREFAGPCAGPMVKSPASMSRITADEVRELALLARLRLSDQEVAAMTDNLGAILEYVEALRALDTGAVEPMTHAVPFDCPTRPDEVKPSLPVDDALANAPRRDGDFFQVPRIVPGPGADSEGA